MRTQPIQPFPAMAGPAALRRLNQIVANYLARVQWPTVIIGTSLFVSFIILFAFIQFATPALAGNDGYYHIKLAQIMREQGLRPPFPWLPLTVLNPTDYVDHHFLYHVLLIPFTWGDLRLGAKWASVIIPAFTFLSGWLLLRGQRVAYAPLWALGFFAASEAFLYRMSMPRAQSASLLVLLLGLHLLLTRRHRWLLLLAFAYVWLYDAFPLLLLVAGIYVATRWLLDQQFEPAPLLYVTLGIGLGLVINPYFPNNLLFVYHHLLPKLTETTATSVGKEWYPYYTWTLVENSGPALIIFASGAFALGLRKQSMDTPTATLLLLTFLFGAMLFKSRRFIEYFPAFALLFAALAWTPLFAEWGKARAWIARDLPVLLVVALVPTILFNVQTAQASLQKSKSYQTYAGASAWLKANTPAGSRVFQTDWDDFARLYYYNTHNTYTAGLDPTYMQLYNPNLYKLWVNISRGRQEAPAWLIANTFGASYVLTDLKHKSFLRQAQADPYLLEVYRDEDAVVFRVVDPAQEKGVDDSSTDQK